MIESALILCAGDGKRWGNYLGIPKQNIQIANETLLDRTIRLLRLRGVKKINIISNDTRLQKPGCEFTVPKYSRFIVETFLSVVDNCDTETAILLGDVYYTKRCIYRILSCDHDIMFFGRPWPSIWSGCTHGEIFAFLFRNDLQRNWLINCAQSSLKHGLNGGRGNLWNMYQAYSGKSFDSKDFESSYFSIISDFTEDFDTPSEYEFMLCRYILLESGSRFELFFLFILILIKNPLWSVLARRSQYLKSPVPPLEPE